MPATARALDAYFVVGAEHGFNASTFTARVITSTRSDIASAVVGAIGTMKGPLHGGAPSEVVDQLSQVGSPEHAEQWLREALDRGERLMGFGHRVYRAYDPRAAALRTVAEGMEHKPSWLQLAIEVEDVALRVLAERHPDRPLKTNVEFYAAPVLMGVGLSPDLFPATFSLARHAGWTAHALEQAANNRLIRPGRQLRRRSGARPPRLIMSRSRRLVKPVHLHRPRRRSTVLQPRAVKHVQVVRPTGICHEDAGIPRRLSWRAGRRDGTATPMTGAPQPVDDRRRISIALRAAIGYENPAPVDHQASQAGPEAAAWICAARSRRSDR